MLALFFFFLYLFISISFFLSLTSFFLFVPLFLSLSLPLSTSFSRLISPFVFVFLHFLCYALISPLLLTLSHPIARLHDTRQCYALLTCLDSRVLATLAFGSWVRRFETRLYTSLAHRSNCILRRTNWRTCSESAAEEGK